jgi:L-ribulose-5-phosphate 4-epimerase
MRLAKLREQVLEANLVLVRRGLVLSTFGNASGVARKEGLIVIKPSSVPCDRVKPKDLVVTDLQGEFVAGNLRPSSDLPTHAALYRAFPSIGGIAHTHSEYATAWAQARKPIPCFGTSHADYFHGPIPLTEVMADDEINGEYEANTGAVIVRAFKGLDPREAAENAWMLEAAARMAYLTVAVNANASTLGKTLHDRHFLRKHGAKAYYGQKKSKK